MSGINIKLREYWLSAIVSAKSTVKAVAPTKSENVFLYSKNNIFSTEKIARAITRFSTIEDYISD